MKNLQNNIPFILMLAMTLAAVSSFPSVVHGEELSRWELKTSAVLVDAGKNAALDQPAGGQTQADGDVELGLGIAIEYRLSDRVSLELARVSATAMDLSYRLNGESTAVGEGIRFMPILAGANLHLLQSERVSLYAGPRVAYVNFGGFSTAIDGETTAYEIDNEFGWGAVAGAKYQFGDSAWSLLVEASYLDVDTEITPGNGAETIVDSFNPLMLTIGLSHRF